MVRGKWFYPDKDWRETDLYDSWLSVGWGSTIHDDYPADDLHLHEFPFGEPLSLRSQVEEICERNGI